MQTPHPTLQSQSQVFKLPSSSPQPSPRPLSPVPSSRRLKENKPQATSTPWNRHALNPFASGIGIPTLPRKPRARSGRPRPSRSHSRSSSNSHSNASSRANSKERSKSTTDVRTRKKTKLAHKPPLASPFVSRASSPIDNASNPAHIPTSTDLNHNKSRIIHQYTSKAKRSANVLTDTFIDPNIPHHPRPGSQSVQTSPSKGNPGAAAHRDLTVHTAKRPHQKLKNPLQRRIYAASERNFDLEVQHSYRLREDGSNYTRERRPSAPSSLRPTQQDASLPLADRLPRLSTLGPGRSRNKPLLDAKDNATQGSAPAGHAAHLQESELHTFLDQLRSTKAEAAGQQRAPPPPPAQSLQSPSPQQNQQQQNAPGLHKPAAHRLPVRPSASMHDLHTISRTNNHNNNLMLAPAPPDMRLGLLALGGHTAHAVDTDDERTAWMRVRRIGVDFNRPPSQMSLVEAGGYDLGMAVAMGSEGWGWEDTVFTSEEEESEDDVEAEKGGKEVAGAGGKEMRRAEWGSGLNFGFEFGDENGSRVGVGQGLSFPVGLGAAFGEDVMGASTPADAVKRRRARGKRKKKALIDEGGVREVRRSTSMPMRLDDDGGGNADVVEEDEDAEVEKEGVRRSVSLDEVGMRKACAEAYHRDEVDRDDDEDEEEDEEEEEAGGEEDMELTGSGVNVGRIFALDGIRRVGKHGSEAYRNDEDQDADADDEEGSEVSWITDSLISAPTVYLERKRERTRMEGVVSSDYDEYDEETSGAVDSLFVVGKFVVGGGNDQMHNEQDGDEDEDKDEENEKDDEHEEGETEDEEEDEKNPTPTQSHFAASDNSSSSNSRVASPSRGVSSSATAAATTMDTNTTTKMPKTTTKTTTRTRSGTIVPANANANSNMNVNVNPDPNMGMAGARRTRSGTIVGPLPAIPGDARVAGNDNGNEHDNGIGSQRVVGAAPTRTRTGTIVASASVVQPVSGVGSGRARSGSVRWAQTPMESDAGRGFVQDIRAVPINEDATDEEHGHEQEHEQEHDHDQVVECYVDSLYLPPDALQESSSPDPIDFLRFAGIAEAEEEDEEGGCGWRRVVETKGSSARGARGTKCGTSAGAGPAKGGRSDRGGRATSVGRWARAKKRLRAKFGAGCGEEDEDGDGELSEDELLLKSD